MAIVKIINSNNLSNLINYINDAKGHNDEIIYFNGIGVNPRTAIRDMELCKKVYCQTRGSQGKHIIVGFNKVEENQLIEKNIIDVVADNIARTIYFHTGCQIVYAVHGNTDNIHIHFALNSVRISDGYKIQLNYRVKYMIEKDIRAYLSCIVNNKVYV